MRNGLSNEERFHWCNVILAAPGHKLARQRLNVREIRGGLFTEKQVADLMALMEEVRANRVKFLQYLKVEKLSDIPAKDYQKAVSALEAKRR